MSDLVLSDLDARILSRLGAAAAAHGRTVEVEAKEILAAAVGARPNDSWAAVDAIRQRLTESKRMFSDSLELLHEDRLR